MQDLEHLIAFESRSRRYFNRRTARHEAVRVHEREKQLTSTSYGSIDDLFCILQMANHEYNWRICYQTSTKYGCKVKPWDWDRSLFLQQSICEGTCENHLMKLRMKKLANLKFFNLQSWYMIAGSMCRERLGCVIDSVLSAELTLWWCNWLLFAKVLANLNKVDHTRCKQAHEASFPWMQWMLCVFCIRLHTESIGCLMHLPLFHTTFSLEMIA
jgi:hypothetical protein